MECQKRFLAGVVHFLVGCSSNASEILGEVRTPPDEF